MPPALPIGVTMPLLQTRRNSPRSSWNDELPSCELSSTSSVTESPTWVGCSWRKRSMWRWKPWRSLVADPRLPDRDRKPAFLLDRLDQVDGGDKPVSVRDPAMRLGREHRRGNALNLRVGKCIVEHHVLQNAGSRPPCRGDVPRW